MTNQTANTIVITRHPALVQLLRERGIIDPPCPVCGERPGEENEFSSCHVVHARPVTIVPHATPALVRGKHVIGVLPLGLAALATSITEIPLALSPEMRGKELDLSTLRQVAGEPVTYKVEVLV